MANERKNQTTDDENSGFGATISTTTPTVMISGKLDGLSKMGENEVLDRPPASQRIND